MAAPPPRRPSTATRVSAAGRPDTPSTSSGRGEVRDRRRHRDHAPGNDESRCIATPHGPGHPLPPRSSPRRLATSLSGSLSGPSERGIGCPPYRGYAFRTPGPASRERCVERARTPSWMAEYLEAGSVRARQGCRMSLREESGSRFCARSDLVTSCTEYAIRRARRGDVGRSELTAPACRRRRGICLGSTPSDRSGAIPAVRNG